MAFQIKDTLQTVQSHLSASGYFQDVVIGEPKQPTGTRLSAAVFMNEFNVIAATLTGTVELHSVALRLYRDMLAEPQGDADTDLDNAIAHVEEDLLGDFDLGSTIRNINVDGLSTTWGYIDLGGTEYRIADMSLSMIVDDSASFVK